MQLSPAHLRELHTTLQHISAEVGLEAVGITPLHAEENPAPDFSDLEYLEPWVAQGRAGQMNYLKRRTDSGRLQRERIGHSLSWARSVIVCAMNYNAGQPRSLDPAPADAGWIARYATSGTDAGSTDYHQVLLAKLRQLESALHQQFGNFESRCYVDTGPFVERVYARHAGIGWVGKNTCLIREGFGSWFFLGVIVTSLELSDAATPPALAPDRCGSCTRCIDACPTAAIVQPYQLDASRCIAYLTIEKRGAIPAELREGIGRNIFGCDICQEVCPWNGFANEGQRQPPVSTDPKMQARATLLNPALSTLAALTHADFRRLFRDSPIERKRFKRMSYKTMRRNIAIAMGNSGQQKFLPQLHLWAQSPDPVLAESALWAIQKLENATPAIS